MMMICEFNRNQAIAVSPAADEVDVLFIPMSCMDHKRVQDIECNVASATVVGIVSELCKIIAFIAAKSLILMSPSVHRIWMQL